MCVQSALVDSGPLIALFDRDDRHHERVKAFLKTHPLRLFATWPVLTEVCALLPQQCAWDFMEFVQRGGLWLEALETDDIAAILEQSRRYADRPMDLADASLVILAIRLGINRILSLDADFDIYRLPGKKACRNLLAK
jgi:predicted nucleic acid-binding protein